MFSLPHCNIFYMIVLWCIEVNLFLSAWLLYLYAPAGFTKGEALNTVPADNRQRHRSLATGGPHWGGLIPTDWTRVLYHGATHRRVGGGRRERTDRQTDRQGGRDRNTETESVKHRHAVADGVSGAVKRTWLRLRRKSRTRSGPVLLVCGEDI